MTLYLAMPCRKHYACGFAEIANGQLIDLILPALEPDEPVGP